MRIYTSTGDGSKSFEQQDAAFERDERSEYRQVICFPDLPRQRILGFGAALTESSAWTFAQMPPPCKMSS